jgi:hypothetical protein
LLQRSIMVSVSTYRFVYSSVIFLIQNIELVIDL